MALRCFFTLVEMLVVVSILLILVSILLPALNTARESGKAIYCANSLKNMGMAQLQYDEDYDGHLTLTHDSVAQQWAWTTRITPYLNLPNGTSRFFCNVHTQSGFSRIPQTFKCPSDITKTASWSAYPDEMKLSYSVNDAGLAGLTSRPDNQHLGPFHSVLAPRLSQINNPSSLIMKGDAWRGGKSLDDTFGSYIGLRKIFYVDSTLIANHKNNGNFIFFDGSVRRENPVSLEEGNYSLCPSD